VRCPNCAAEIADDSQFCGRCGAPATSRPPAPPLPAEGAARQLGQAGLAASRMKVAAGVASIASAVLIVLACALPYVRVKSFTGSHFTNVSIFSAGGTDKEGIAGALGMLGGYLLAGAGVVAAASQSLSWPRR
jgi:hypothetical protein